jgi:hypothetical protein
MGNCAGYCCGDEKANLAGNQANTCKVDETNLILAVEQNNKDRNHGITMVKNANIKMQNFESNKENSSDF